MDTVGDLEDRVKSGQDRDQIQEDLRKDGHDCIADNLVIFKR
jgi:hypothetical protein